MYTIEEFDEAKTKVLRYVLYKKRTESEVRTKFATSLEETILNDIIEYLKEANYISDEEYIEKYVRELMNLKHLSVREVIYKLYQKGLNKRVAEDYISNHIEELQEYEEESARYLLNKKSASEQVEETIEYLLKKGYKKDSIDKVLEE